MGNRGALPKIVNEYQPLDGVDPPDWLDEEAKLFHKKHVKSLVENRLLGAQTADSWYLLCELYGRLAAFRGQPTSRTYLDCYKQFVAVAKMFRMLPTEKPGKEVEHRGQTGKTFNWNEE